MFNYVRQACNFAVLYFCLFRSRTSAPSEINGHQSGCIGTKAYEPDMLGYQKTGLTPSLLKQLVLCSLLCLTYTLHIFTFYFILHHRFHKSGSVYRSGSVSASGKSDRYRERIFADIRTVRTR